MAAPNRPSHSPHTPLISQIPPNPQHKRRVSDELPSFLGDYVPTFNAADIQRATAQLPSTWEQWSQYLHQQLSYHYTRFKNRRWRWQDMLDVRFYLILIWISTLNWGEHGAFNSSIQRCDWRHWEQWPSEAQPYRVALVADPQLVDPHTYPGRPWPLSWATVKYTDLYLRKSFSLLASRLDPQSVFFLGDLFDGGREWSPPGNEADPVAEKRWRKYAGTTQWFSEYARFSRIFIDPWRNAQKGRDVVRRIFTGLPGNHDLGLGNGIRLPVRERFNAYFGESNRIDILGNHSFLSLDTVSLSARNQPSAEHLGIPNSGDAGPQIWEPTLEFLNTVKATKGRAVDRLLQRYRSLPENPLLDPTVFDIDSDDARKISFQYHTDTGIPSILLTHIPFYRAPGTPCGPLRERHPPSQPSPSDGKDERNAITVAAGHQYQNVLTAPLSAEIIDLVPDITHIFSGDDHDHCDMLHREFTGSGGGIREVTVKSLSWAMGVRLPGFQLLSLWNPIDPTTGATLPGAPKPTLQTHLCLLPDQLGIFIRYAILLACTLFTLLLYTLFHRNTRKRGSPLPNESLTLTNGGAGTYPLLPTTRLHSPPPDPPLPPHSHSANSSTSTTASHSTLSARSTTTITSAGNAKRNGSPNSGGYSYRPSLSHQGPPQHWSDIDLDGSNIQKRPFGHLTLFQELKYNLTIVAAPVGVWYLYLLYTS